MRNMPIRRGSVQHEALRQLFVHDAMTGEALRKAIDHGNVPSAPYFRENVLGALEGRLLIEPIGRGEYRITRTGRQVVIDLAVAPTARVTPIHAPSPAFVRPQLLPGVDFHLLLSSPARSMSDADKRPTPVRRDGMDFAQWPSRRGDRLYYRDGRVTDMDGNRIEVRA